LTCARGFGCKILDRYTTYTTPEEDGTKSLDYADGGVVDTPAVCGAVSQGATKIVSVISFPDALKSGKGPFVATEGEPCTWKVDPDSAYIQFVAQYFGQGPYSSGAVAPLGAPGMLNQIFANQARDHPRPPSAAAPLATRPLARRTTNATTSFSP